MRRTARFAVTAAVATTFIASACVTTELKEQWRDATYRSDGAQRVLVVAVVGQPDRRHILEDKLVAHLQQAGITATVSYRLLPVDGPENRDAVRRVVEQTGSTMVLSVRLVNVQQETVVTGGYNSAPTGFYAYHSSALSSLNYYEPPQAYTHRTFFSETRLFDIKSDRLVWAGTLKSKEPDDFKKAADEYAGLVVKQIQRDNIIGNKG